MGFHCVVEPLEAGRCFREGWDDAPLSTDAGPDAEPAASPSSPDADTGPVLQPDAASARRDAAPRPPPSDATDSPDPDSGLPQPSAACEPLQAAADRGSFVSPPPTGSDAEGCGTPAAPCATIAQARDRSLALGRPLVYLDSGSYAEAVVLLPGITLQGGWNNLAGVWTRQCSSNRAESARLQSPRSFALWAEYDGEAQLDTLSLETIAAASTGQSLYGVFARGATTHLVLNDVRVRSSNGGAGSAGRTGASPAAASGTCPAPGDGTNGTRDGNAGLGAAIGGWTSEGYSPGVGQAGEPGIAGQNGTLEAPVCVTCVDACNRSTCSGNETNVQSCGQAGSPGCGGAAAEGGEGGGGGGSSVGIFAWSAQVRVQGGWLEAGDGGDAGDGGAPGEGAAGSEGTVGANARSCTVCQKISLAPESSSDSAGSEGSDRGELTIHAPLQCIGGLAAGIGGRGGRGGAGTRGGAGGGGAGGHSFGAYTGGAAVLAVSPETRIQVGQPGLGRGTGAAGIASELSSD